MMKQTLIASAMLATTSTAALAEISGNVALSSDYVWRGISQTDSQIAISGGFDYAHDSGLYIGTWASNVNSDFFDNSVDPQIELDVYGGYAGEMGAIGYDLGFIEYIYPGSSDLNTLELYAGGSYAFTDMISASAKYYYSDDFFDSDESAWRLEGGVEVGLPQDFGLSATVGKNDGDFFDGGFDYVDYSIGVSKSFVGLDFGLTYTDTDLDSVDCPGFENSCDGRAVFSVSKSL